MLISQFLLHIYPAHSASPDVEFYKIATRAMNVDEAPFSPDARFKTALVQMREDLTHEQARNKEIEVLLPSLTLEKSRLETTLALLQTRMQETESELRDKLKTAGEQLLDSQQQRDKMADDLATLKKKQEEDASSVLSFKQKLAEVDKSLQQTQEEKLRIEESLGKYRQTEQELRENLKELESVLKQSNAKICILTGQSALNQATVETYVKEVGGFVVMVEAIVSTNKELGRDCRLLTEALEMFKRDSTFSHLAQDLKSKFDSSHEDTVTLFNEKKQQIRADLDAILSQIKL